MESLSINDFCRLHGISQSFYFKLRRQGKAPQSFRVGRLRRISPDAAREWAAARQLESANAA